MTPGPKSWGPAVTAAVALATHMHTTQRIERVRICLPQASIHFAGQVTSKSDVQLVRTGQCANRAKRSDICWLWVDSWAIRRNSGEEGLKILCTLTISLSRGTLSMKKSWPN